jgi:hypothetical protein
LVVSLNFDFTAMEAGTLDLSSQTQSPIVGLKNECWVARRSSFGGSCEGPTRV